MSDELPSEIPKVRKKSGPKLGDPMPKYPQPGTVGHAALMHEMLTAIGEGVWLRRWCREGDGKRPSWRLVNKWIAEDPNLARQYQTARILGSDAFAMDILDIVSDSSRPVDERRMLADVHLRLLAKWFPSRYGEKLAIGGAADLPAIRSTQTREDREARIIALLGGGKAKPKLQITNAAGEELTG